MPIKVHSGEFKPKESELAERAEKSYIFRDTAAIENHRKYETENISLRSK